MPTYGKISKSTIALNLSYISAPWVLAVIQKLIASAVHDGYRIAAPSRVILCALYGD